VIAPISAAAPKPDRLLDVRLVACLCWVLICLSARSTAAIAQYRFVSWTTENGLPNNWIMAIHQTRDGYIWLTTKDGAARFDGVRFQVFNKVNTPGLTTNRFAYRALWEDSQGNLWMGTEDGGVVQYHDGVFTSLTTKDGLPSNKVIRIDGDATGTIWITTSAGMVCWRNGHLVLPRSSFDRSLDSWLTQPKNFTFDAAFFGLWRFTAGEWQRFAYGHWSPLPMPPGIRDPANVHVEAITEDPERRLWYSLAVRPHEYYCLSRGHLKVIRGVPNVTSTQICCQDREGRIWMGNHYGAVGLWQGGRFQRLPGIATSNVFQVMEDREGSLWIATLDRGLDHLENQVISAYRRPGGVQQANVIGPMLQGQSGAVWLGSGGLTKFEDGRFTTFYRPHHSRHPWDWGNLVDALYQDRDGSLWAHMWDGSIVRFKDGRFHQEKSLSAAIKGRLNVIFRDRAGDMWFGGRRGLYRLHAGVLTHFTAPNGLPGNEVNVIEEGRAGKLWIGTNAGLVQYVGGKFTPVEGLRGNRIEALYEDKTQVWWAGTLDDGLYRLASGPNGLKIARYTTAEGLYSNRADAILEDDLGYLWMSCDLGLYRVSKQALNDLALGRIAEVTCTHFGASDGLPGEISGFGQVMAFKARHGRLWFATQDGVAVVDPRAVTVSRRPPPIRIEGCLVDLHPVACGPGLRLKPGHTNLEINYTALSFIRPEQIHFNYELEGLERRWVQAGTRRTAYYPHLPPGDYIFKVIAANSDGVWNTKGESLGVVVLPPFYRTWWFLTLVSLVGAGVIVLAWRSRVAQLKHANALQQAFSRQLINSQEQERKRIAAELHDSLGQSLAIIKNRAVLSLSVPDDHTRALEQLDEIAQAASHAIGEVREIAYNLRPYHLERLGLTKSIEAMLKRASTNGGVRFAAEIEPVDGLFSAEAQISLYRILQEAVSNIVKHAEATEAKISVKHSATGVDVVIQDNGRGLARGLMDHTEAARGGFGLIGIAERARLLGGDLTTDSAPGGGAILRIRLRTDNSHHVA
jgi:signal transduction histidine kinase/ligand-binding sensor domain-containing protein